MDISQDMEDSEVSKKYPNFVEPPGRFGADLDLQFLGDGSQDKGVDNRTKTLDFCPVVIKH